MSVRESEPSGIQMQSLSVSEVPMDNHSTDPDRHSPKPSAPLLSSDPENPAVQDMPPPSYSSVIAEDNRSFLQIINQQPHSMLPLLPESRERPKEPDDIEDVITTQPTHMNTGIADTEDMMKTDPSLADEDPKKRRKENPDLYTHNAADRVIINDYSCCCISWHSTPFQFNSSSNAGSGEPSDHHGCCSAGDSGNDADNDCCCFGCCNDSGDGCCDGGGGGGGGGDGCCDGSGGDGCCDGGGVDGCCDGGGGGDCGDCDCSGCFS